MSKKARPKKNIRGSTRTLAQARSYRALEHDVHFVRACHRVTLKRCVREVNLSGKTKTKKCTPDPLTTGNWPSCTPLNRRQGRVGGTLDASENGNCLVENGRKSCMSHDTYNVYTGHGPSRSTVPCLQPLMDHRGAAGTSIEPF